MALALAVATGGCAATSGGEPPQSRTAKLDEAAVDRIFGLAEKAVAEGRYADAKKMVQRVMVNDPHNPRGRLILGEIFLGQGQPAKALRFFAPSDRPEQAAQVAASPPAEDAGDPHASQSGPRDPRALQGEGIALLRLGKWHEGKAALEGAVAANPDLWRAWNGLGFHHDRNGDWEAAEAAYDKALTAGGHAAAVYNNRGFSRLMQGRPDSAIEDFGQALRLDPDLAVAETNMRLALAWRGDYVRSVAGVGQAEKGAALNNAGFVAMLRGDYDSAESYLARAMDADVAFNAAAHKNLAYLKTLRQADDHPIEAQVGMSAAPEPGDELAE